jgi:hypothetical protein
VSCTELASSNRDCTVSVFVMPPSDPEQPPTKRGKCAAYSLEEKVCLLDHAAKNPKVSADELGKALAAHVNAQLPGQEKRRAPGKNTLNGWKREDAKPDSSTRRNLRLALQTSFEQSRQSIQ